MDKQLVEVHLYGKLRVLAPNSAPDADSIIRLPLQSGDTILSVLGRIGIPLEETSNLFLNGEFSAPSRNVAAGDRLGVFPSDMALLYKWYFKKTQ